MKRLANWKGRARRDGRWAGLAMLFAATCSLTSAFAADTLAVKDVKILIGDGQTIEKGTIVVRDGKIVAVGADIEIPVDAQVIDGAGKTIMPGIVEVHSAEAMSQANEQNDNVPFLSVVDSIDPSKPYFEESRRNGVTSVAVMPGNSTMIGGSGAVMKTSGAYVNDMLLKRDVGMKFSLTPQSGSSRMSHFAKLRRQLQEAKEALDQEAKVAEASEEAADGETTEESESTEESDSDSGSSRPTPTSASAQQKQRVNEALSDVLRGKSLAYFYCDQAMDVSRALELSKEFGLKPLLVLGRDCDKAAAVLAREKQAVVLDPTLVFWRTDPRTREDEKIVMPKVLLDAGVEFVFGVDDSTSRTASGSHYHWYQAATAVKHGLTRDDAVKALTLKPAELLGIDKFVGSLEVGKDADMVILTGDPLSVSSWVETTIINGQVAYERDKDIKLKRLLEPSEDDL